MASDGRGWHGDSAGHARAGSKSSGNKNAALNLTHDARSRGGQMSSGKFEHGSERARQAGQRGGSR